MAKFVTFVGVHGEVAVNPERVLYAAPLPDTGDCWLYFGGKGAAEEGHPPVIVVQVKGALSDVVAKLEGAGAASSNGEGQSPVREDRDDRPPLVAAAEDEPMLLPGPDAG